MVDGVVVEDAMPIITIVMQNTNPAVGVEGVVAVVDDIPVVVTAETVEEEVGMVEEEVEDAAATAGVTDQLVIVEVEEIHRPGGHSRRAS